ncbi:high affinity immunoglobulin gamma Fc receptor I-like isoform X2 [Poecilia latipinna]|uniref:high affinity immunoglobulin gamma Fc receptor I-like isoform X2 n=1 Tax=Poecilia latipinna TaxID=48699 RepID=UPI00072DFB36|nr:PREDICTED: high affinity immunoglobulin gamma Fc receptor I-like isoform X2 [Poecilia latipinna]
MFLWKTVSASPVALEETSGGSGRFLVSEGAHRSELTVKMEMVFLRLLFLTSLLCSSTHQARLVVDFSSSQLFEGTRVTLKCEADDGSEGWTMKRNTTKRQSTCGDGWGKRTNSSCTIEFLFVQDSGLYWCESMSGSSSSSSSIQLSVSGGSVILQSPVLPVMEGDDVTLSCRAKSPAHNLPAAFYKDGVFIGNESSGHMTLLHVSSSDEGLYNCSISGQGESPSSRISVIAKPAATPPSSGAAPSTSGPLQLAYTVLRHLVVFCPYFISTIIMVSLYQPKPFETNLESSPPTESEPGIEVKVEVTAKNCV